MNIIKKYLQEIRKIGGEGIIVEVDGSNFGKKKYQRGGCSRWCLDIRAVKRTDSRRIILKKCKTRNSDTIISFLRQFIHLGSIIFSDGWRGCNNLNIHFYGHFKVNNSI
ncbi:hypothetical protein DMUE_4177 [Dictyocoela muelleri]|nr:hypothetical protein DMUE_4177 [Dictyocoela muelleri]